jgi:hypothetical protein
MRRCRSARAVSEHATRTERNLLKRDWSKANCAREPVRGLGATLRDLTTRLFVIRLLTERAAGQAASHANGAQFGGRSEEPNCASERVGSLRAKPSNQIKNAGGGNRTHTRR